MKISQIALLLLAVQQTCALVAEVHQVSKVKPPEGIKTVTHAKKANDGYQKGSPLYKKQEGIKEAAGNKTTAEQTDSTAGYMLIKNPSLFTTLATVSVYAVFVLAFAYIFKSRMQAPAGARDKGESPKNHPAVLLCGFSYSIFDYSNLKSDWHICLLAYCCPILQWARTASSSGTPFMSYWKAIAFLLIMVVLAPFTYGLTSIVIACVFLKRRQALRKDYSSPASVHPETRSMVEDACLIFCCPSFLCCQLVQEARQVEYTTSHQPMAPA